MRVVFFFLLLVGFVFSLEGPKSPDVPNVEENFSTDIPQIETIYIQIVSGNLTNNNFSFIFKVF